MGKYIYLISTSCFTPVYSMPYCLHILQLINRGKVDVKDVASEIGVSPDSLSATLAVMHESICFLHCNEILLKQLLVIGCFSSLFWVFFCCDLLDVLM